MSDRRDWPIVVGGCHRSGTSLVRRILDSHSRIHCGPEITFFRDFYGAFQDDPLAHLRFTRTVRSLVPEEEALDALGRAFVELHERAARTAGKARWADKAPENVLYADAWERLLAGRFVFVHVVRNPLDTVASMEGRFPRTLPAELDRRIELFRTYTEAGLTFGASSPDRYLRIVYEELCDAPAEVVGALMGSLGEQAEPSQLRFNEYSHQEGLEDPEIALTDRVHRESVGRWASALTAAQVADVWTRTQDLWESVDPERRHVAALFRGS